MEIQRKNKYQIKKKWMKFKKLKNTQFKIESVKGEKKKHLYLLQQVHYNKKHRRN